MKGERRTKRASGGREGQVKDYKNGTLQQPNSSDSSLFARRSWKSCFASRHTSCRL